MTVPLQALGEGDGTLRGSALEYLGNGAPEGIRDGLWHYRTAPLPHRQSSAWPHCAAASPGRRAGPPPEGQAVEGAAQQSTILRYEG